jgi:hypothetical protein
VTEARGVEAREDRVGYNIIPIMTLSLATCLFYIYSYRYNYLRLGEHVMVI